MAKKKQAPRRKSRQEPEQPATKPRRKSEPVVPAAPEYESKVGSVLINNQRRVGLVTADCAAWTRLLRIGDDCVVAIVRMTPEELVNEGWKPLECEHAAFKLANTLARTPLPKTAAAAQAIAEVQQAADIDGMTVEQISAEVNRLHGNGTELKFDSKREATAALRRAIRVVNIEQQKDAKATGAKVATTKQKENDMAAKKAKTTKAKTTKAKTTKAKTTKPAKKEAGPKKAGGIGALVRELIGKGKENGEIVDTVLQKFPGAKTNSSNVSWYRNQMKKG